jgi:hypothetical protein
MRRNELLEDCCQDISASAPRSFHSRPFERIANLRKPSLVCPSHVGQTWRPRLAFPGRVTTPRSSQLWQHLLVGLPRKRSMLSMLKKAGLL